MTTALFDGVSLLTTAYNPRFIQHESAPERDVQTLAPARGDGDVLVTERYGQKRIQLRGTLSAASAAALDAAIDAMKELFSRREKNLDLDFAGGTRRYVATCTQHAFARDYYNIDAVPWTAEFVVVSGEGSDTASTALKTSSNQLTAAAHGAATDILTFAGTKAPRPVITLEGSTDGGGGQQWAAYVKGLRYRNADTGEELRVVVDGTWLGSGQKRIIIDCNARKVYETITTGTQREAFWSGVFPTFKIGANNVSITPGDLPTVSSNETALVEGASFAIPTSDYRAAQSFFVPYSDATFQQVLIAIYKEGGSSYADLTARIETDNGGKPSGTLAHANATKVVSEGAIGTTAAYLRIVFDNKFPLSANTRYWLVLKNGGGGGSVGYYRILTGNYYPQGIVLESSNAGSTYAVVDSSAEFASMMFQVQSGGRASSGSVFAHMVDYVKRYL